ncbi:hypothetical protein BZA05DRAFT_348047 [Tricharina praecox]|uniref:uncharacterized protein n=1 Tax=Tricharina praecox TaxID=43433 RepID=UPI00221FAF29|nr:uncharacterized protein BZA05DRAFT_348047 [Tricharina praecox]KAI5856932.1 hypothetical protein BZA05DRAFT_348047 [Tricharina praecox]
MSMAKISTPRFLTSLRAIPHLPPNSWYYLASVTFAVLNRPLEIPAIYTAASAASAASAAAVGGSPAAERAVLDRTREALLKASAIGGLPSSINALNALKAVVPPELLDAPSPTARAEGVRMHAGQMLWESIYGKVGPRVMSGMRRSYDDLGTVAALVYAGVLAEEAVLSNKETGWVLVAGLVTGGEAWAAQRKGHRRGCVNNGATWEEVEAVETMAERIVDEVKRVSRGEEDELLRAT